MNGIAGRLPDYDNCLVNLANSVLKRFGAETLHKTLPLADTYLSDGHRNVVVLLMDAMGMSILEKHLDKDGFLRSHCVWAFDSVYPPTTVAATTSILSGLYPNEHCWLGWDIYYPGIGKNVTVFSNNEQLREKDGAEPVGISSEGKKIWDESSLEEPKPAADFHASFAYTPYKNLIDRINGAGGKAFASIPFLPPFPSDFDAILRRVEELCKEDGEKYIYAYWDEPDQTMHRTGTKSKETKELVRTLEKKIEEFASRLEDTLLIITADHSHMDSENHCMLDYPDICECLLRKPSFEPRTLNLFVKEECRDSFPEIFKKHFGDNFLLLTREEVLEEKVFGPEKDNDLLKELIGDFVALAVSPVSVFNTHYEGQVMPGGHAGLTKEEIKIPLIVVER